MGELNEREIIFIFVLWMIFTVVFGGFVLNAAVKWLKRSCGSKPNQHNLR